VDGVVAGAKPPFRSGTTLPEFEGSIFPQDLDAGTPQDDRDCSASR
jgi:hypothetical protein